jgi:hypothetical protein
MTDALNLAMEKAFLAIAEDDTADYDHCYGHSGWAAVLEEMTGKIMCNVSLMRAYTPNEHKKIKAGYPCRELHPTGKTTSLKVTSYMPVDSEIPDAAVETRVERPWSIPERPENFRKKLKTALEVQRGIYGILERTVLTGQLEHYIGQFKSLSEEGDAQHSKLIIGDNTAGKANHKLLFVIDKKKNVAYFTRNFGKYSYGQDYVMAGISYDSPVHLSELIQPLKLQINRFSKAVKKH